MTCANARDPKHRILPPTAPPPHHHPHYSLKLECTLCTLDPSFGNCRWRSVSSEQPDRALARKRRRKETKQFPNSTHPPNLRSFKLIQIVGNKRTTSQVYHVERTAKGRDDGAVRGGVWR